ncbi:MAG: hypothetical protein AABN95_15985 [Acidobacteriota bacterium]
MATAAKACRKALADATERWPNRNRASDGIMGDAAHQARKSDHNDGNAFDVTHDPKNGPDGNVLTRDLVDANDPRVTYIIWNKKIWKPGKGWARYTGANPHTKHFHVSIKASSRDDLRSWPWTPGAVSILSVAGTLAAAPKEVETPPTVQEEAKGVTTSDKPASEAEGTLPPTPAVEIKASETSWQARLGSISIPTGVTAAIAAVAGFVGNIPPYAWFALAGVVVVAMVIGFLVWREKSREAHERTKIVLNAGADQDKNNLRLI